MEDNIDYIHRQTLRELNLIRRLLKKGEKRKINSLIIGREFDRKCFHYVVVRKRENTKKKKKNLSETDILLVDMKDDKMKISQWIHRMSQSRYLELNTDVFLPLKHCVPISAISFENMLIQLKKNGAI